MKFEKNDQVRIVDTGDVWEGKIGKVYSEQDEEILTTDGHDLTQVDVLVKIDTAEGEKQVMKNFNRENLQPVQEESLVEQTLNEDAQDQEKPIESEEEFIQHFIGKSGVFRGFDYEDLFTKVEQEDGSFDFKEEDTEEIDYYRLHEGQSCTIVASVVADWEPWDSIEDSFNRSRWDIQLIDGTSLEAIPGYAIDLSPAPSHVFDDLDEAWDPQKREKNHNDYDIVEPFVYQDYGDEELIPSWCLLERVASYYGVDASTVLEYCRKYKHKVWNLMGPVVSPRLIVAAKEITADDLKEAYADYVDRGRGVTVEEIKL